MWDKNVQNKKKKMEQSVVITWKKKPHLYIQVRGGLLKQVWVIECLTEIVIIHWFLVLIHK